MGDEQLENIEINIDEKDKNFALKIWANVPARCTVEIITPTRETTKMVYPSISSMLKVIIQIGNGDTAK